jgi:hypothetical protein
MKMLSLELAKKHAHNGAIMQSSAVFCLNEAEKHEQNGNRKNAKLWAVKSLAYSIGIFSSDYKTANTETIQPTNQEGAMKMHHRDYNAWQALQVKTIIYKAKKKPQEKHVTIVLIISIILTAAILFILCL